jgi:hypothetical protein
VVFDASAEHLPQAEIRSAIQEELGRPIATDNVAVSERFSVRVNARGLVLEYRTQGSVLERHVPLPSRPEDVPLVIALLAGNLVRDQRASLPPSAPPAKPAREEPEALTPKPALPAKEPVRAAPPRATPAEPQRSFKHHWLGLHIAQDLAIVGGSNVCDPTIGQADASYACYLEGSDDQPFVNTPYPLKDGISTGVVTATTRLLASYDHAFTHYFSLGGRLGYAFGGGPPAGQVVNEGGVVGSNGTPFMPVHAELRASLWLAPPGASFSAYLGANAGLAQVDAKVTVAEKDCTANAQLGMPTGTSEEEAFEACRVARSNFDFSALPDTKVDAWKKTGQGFYGLHAGATIALTDHLSAITNINLMLMTPATAIIIQPSLGVSIAL